MRADVIGNKIVLNHKDTIIDDLFDEGFYAYANAQAQRFVNDTIGVNEVYDNLIHYSFAIERWMSENKPDRVNIAKANKEIFYYTKDVCDKLNIYVECYHFWNPVFSKLQFDFSLLGSAVYIAFLLMKIPYKPGINNAKKFAIVRTKASIKKFKKFGEIQQEVESFYEKESIYRLFSKWTRIKWMAKSYVNAYKQFNAMASFYEPLMGRHFRYSLMNFYKKRIVYAELYRCLLDDYFKHFEGCDFYTGNNLDRYSVVEDQEKVRFNIKSYCIPHGIEYGFKFPKGFSCDVFYVHSQYTADYLNKLYDTNKYIFDENVIRRMFEYHCNKPHEKIIIFFTEPREVNVNLNIVNELLPKMKKKGWKLYLKLHPGDNKANYEGLDVEFITDYDLSMTGNICISRKSTILIEAIYNNSLPVAIITNPKDQNIFNTIPSLNAKEIVKTYSVEELFEVINMNLTV